ncbi:MAG: DEAD/DEAH box helicase [Deltaproteobacteria bacterium]|nr:DEAD/DEAH box helicase [Deltaproteobacteria bacterium]
MGKEITKFYEFGISDELLNSISEMGFEEPTQIQKLAIPVALEGQDMIGIAQTGTGKTASFAIPIIEKGLRGDRKSPTSLVLAPTRELAMQIAQELNKIGKNSGIVTVPIYGGQSIERQFKSLKQKVDIVVGTPGRIIDHLRRKTLSFASVATVILDEADEMLNMGFADDMELILSKTPEDRQTMLFSATMPGRIVELSKKYMKKPKKVKVDAVDLVSSQIKQVFYEVRHSDKLKALTRILDVYDPGLTIVFCHTKREVDELSGKLQQLGYDAGAIHGDFTQNFRDEVIYKFKKGKIDILVATDVAARGLDIKNVSHVINYSIPQNPDAYVHRIGRTGRAGAEGIAITFVTPRESSQLRFIARTAKTTIEKAKLPTQKDVKAAKIKEIKEAITGIIEAGKFKDFRAVVEELSEDFDVVDLAAAALRMATGEINVEHISEGGAKYGSSGGSGGYGSGGDGRGGGSRGGGSRRHGASGMTRLFMTIGKDDKVQVVDLIKTIEKKTKMPGIQIGNVALYDKFSFVEVPEEVAGLVIESINNFKFGSKKVKVEAAGKKDEKRKFSKKPNKRKGKPSKPRR